MCFILFILFTICMVVGEKSKQDAQLEQKLHPRWWCGGVAGAFAQFLLSPIDLLESRMVTIERNIRMHKELLRAIRNFGFLSLYDGLSAQLMRQLTYTTLRFHLYEMGKQHTNPLLFTHKIGVATVAGLAAGFVGIPFEVINTRMHVDRALPVEKQRHYRHVFHALYHISLTEGWHVLYSGWYYACLRSALVTIGQNAIYDQATVTYMRKFGYPHDNKRLHLLSALTAAVCIAPIVQPLEVLKTLRMNSDMKYHKTLFEEISFMLRFGFKGLFRGMLPSTLRLVPSTIIIFILFEQLRLKFGYYEELSHSLSLSICIWSKLKPYCVLLSFLMRVTQFGGRQTNSISTQDCNR